MYPSKDAKAQSLSLSILCDTAFSNPTLVSRDDSQASVQWHAPAGCSFSSEDPSKGGDKDENDGNSAPEETKSVGSGIGWFFLVYVTINPC